VEIEYQLPADFECAHAVFSWMWHTPHLCIPKEVADKGAENDFWKFCNKNLKGYYPACQTEWQDEIFNNCMDAEVVENGEVPMPSPPATLAPTPVSDPEPSPSPAPSPGSSPSPSSPPAMCVPIGQCGSFSWCDQDEYESWCAGHAECPELFCKLTGSEPPAVAPVPSPGEIAPSPAPSSGVTGTCMATLESHFTDASIWEPYCASVGTLGSCPEPMCRMKASFVAVKGRQRRHGFLGTALLQLEAAIVHASSFPEVSEEL